MSYLLRRCFIIITSGNKSIVIQISDNDGSCDESTCCEKCSLNFSVYGILMLVELQADRNKKQRHFSVALEHLQRIVSTCCITHTGVS